METQRNTGLTAAERARYGVIAAALLTPLLAYSQVPAYLPVTTERLLDAQQDQGWLMYRRNYESTGYAPFNQINSGNVGKLKVAFDYESNLFQGHEAAPVVNGNYLFVTTPMDHLIAMEASTGKVLWKYDYPIDEKALKTVCCDVVNRGVALYGDLVYMGTLGNHVVALDAKTGTVKWDTSLAPPGVGYFISGAPLVVNGKVIIGDGGGEYGSRGFIVGVGCRYRQASSGKPTRPQHPAPPAETPGRRAPTRRVAAIRGSPELTISPTQHSVLGRRQSRSLARDAAPRRLTCIPIRCSRSIRAPERSNGTINGRRTTPGTMTGPMRRS